MIISGTCSKITPLSKGEGDGSCSSAEVEGAGSCSSAEEEGAGSWLSEGETSLLGAAEGAGSCPPLGSAVGSALAVSLGASLAVWLGAAACASPKSSWLEEGSCAQAVGKLIKTAPKTNNRKECNQRWKKVY